jgi:general L-amino acid transport system substrate-binding protein
MTFRFMRAITLSLAIVLVATIALPLAAVPAAQAQGGLLDQVRERGSLICGINGSLAGFGFLNPDGTVSGFDADFCRVLAAAIFGDTDAVQYVSVSARDRFPKIQAGEIDVLIRNTTVTFGRDTQQGGEFGPVTYYDGQTFMTRISDGLTSLEQLNGGTICVIEGTTTQINLADIIATNNLTVETLTFESIDQVIEAFVQERCEAVTSDRSQLASRVAQAGDQGREWVIFSEDYSREPLAPVWRAGDAQWGDLVRWSVYATIVAEVHGVTSENIDEMLASPALPAEARRLFGVEGDLHTFLGLSQDWAQNIVRLVGNYGEIFERNLGSLGLERGKNALWRDGGLQFPPVFN